jgi:tRNA threonylcarbamoyladenosine biosynthesis protein TsaE
MVMKRRTIHSRSAEETFAMGKILGGVLEGGDVVALIGDLGTGKTCLTQGIARGLGVPDGYAVTSPTFTLINEYPGKHVLYHLDVYRLEGAQDMEDIGYEEFLFGKGVTVIEWAEKIREILPETTLYIEMTYLDEKNRAFVMAGQEDKMKIVIEALENGGF